MRDFFRASDICEIMQIRGGVRTVWKRLEKTPSVFVRDLAESALESRVVCEKPPNERPRAKSSGKEPEGRTRDQVWLMSDAVTNRVSDDGRDSVGASS
jgi:hypothetical protein